MLYGGCPCIYWFGFGEDINGLKPPYTPIKSFGLIMPFGLTRAAMDGGAALVLLGDAVAPLLVDAVKVGGAEVLGGCNCEGVVPLVLAPVPVADVIPLANPP